MNVFLTGCVIYFGASLIVGLDSYASFRRPSSQQVNPKFADRGFCMRGAVLVGLTWWLSLYFDIKRWREKRHER